MSFARILGAWVVLAVLMSANGIFREAVLVAAVGRAAADVLSVVLGIAIILLVTRVALRPAAGASTAALLRMSVVWLVLTVAFELLVGRYVDGKSWAELGGEYAIWHGRLWPVVLLTLVLSPFLWGRWLRERTAS